MDLNTDEDDGERSVTTAATATKRKIKDENRSFQERWELNYFCTSVSNKIHCLICNSCISVPKEYNVKRHYANHKKAYDAYTGKMRDDKLLELKNSLKRQQTVFIKLNNESESAVKASYILSNLIASHSKSFSEGDFIKECVVKAAKVICPEKVKAFKEIALTRNTVADRINDMSVSLCEQLKNQIADFEFFSLALYESTDVTDVAQLAIFIRACDRYFEIHEELLELCSMHNTTTSEDVFEKLQEVI